jgi:hypothetical protein
MRTQEVLFWYSPKDKGETVSDELSVETMINYGTLNDIHDLFNGMGRPPCGNHFQTNVRSKKEYIS